MKARLHGIDVACMQCGVNKAVWVILNFFYCDECAKGK